MALAVCATGCGQNPHVTVADIEPVAITPGTGNTTGSTPDHGQGNGSGPYGRQDGDKGKQIPGSTFAFPFPALGHLETRLVTLEDGSTVQLEVFVPAMPCTHCEVTR